MGSEQIARLRATSSPHQLYLDSLQTPSAEQIRHISEIQRQKEALNGRKYHLARRPTEEEGAAATKIQAAFRGHRERRQLEGLTLDPSQRWTEAIREMRYRAMSAPHERPDADAIRGRSRGGSTSKEYWTRVGEIARRAGGSPDPRLPEEYTGSNVATGSPALMRAVSGMLMDSRYFLEMTDLKHRYGTNLQTYHEEWLRSRTDQSFFYWLDHGDGKGLEVPGCTRAKLDKERVRYLSREERADYLVRVDDRGKLRWAKNGELITTNADRYRDSIRGIVKKEATPDAPTYNDSPEQEKQRESIEFAEALASISRRSVDRRYPPSESSSDMSSSSTDDLSVLAQAEGPTAQTKQKQKQKHKRRKMVSPATVLNQLLRSAVKPGTFIYVMDTVGRLFVGLKASGAFQHASFLSGARIASAGSIRIEDGQLTYLAPLSGHYRPTTKSFRKFVKHLKEQDVDISQLHISGTYAVLLGMEWYGRSKADMRKIVKHERKQRGNERKRRSGRWRSASAPGEANIVSAPHSHRGSELDDMKEWGMVQDQKRGLSRRLMELQLKRGAKKTQGGAQFAHASLDGVDEVMKRQRE